MGLDDRTWYLFMGIGVGFLLGYATCWFRDTAKKLDRIKEELDEVDDIVKEYHPDWKNRLRQRDERGIISTRFGNAALALVVALTAWAAFQSQRAVDGVHDTQSQQHAATTCTAEILKQTIEVLDTRSQFSRNQASANVDLQRAQSEMIAILLHEPPYSQERQLNAFKAYFQALNDFVDANGKSEDTADANPYPTVEEFNTCIREELTKGS